MIIKKKRTAQNCFPIKWVATSGYARNARPAPEKQWNVWTSFTKKPTLFHDFPNWLFGLHRQVAKRGEDGKTGQDGGSPVDEANDDGVPVAVVVEVVVWAEGNQCAEANPVAVEHLGAGIFPNWKLIISKIFLF